MKIEVSLKCGKNNSAVHEGPSTFMIISH